ncbi:hypothetical protein BDR06DRAFT_124938 [Suillus hirtellus]|nr:hypothetical protein BDR06DRAFT_124938 [Suillus hirtellus]
MRKDKPIQGIIVDVGHRNAHCVSMTPEQKSQPSNRTKKSYSGYQYLSASIRLSVSSHPWVICHFMRTLLLSISDIGLPYHLNARNGKHGIFDLYRRVGAVVRGIRFHQRCEIP